MAFSPILFGPVSRCWTPGPPRVPDVRGVGEGRCRGRDLCGALTAKRHPRRLPRARAPRQWCAAVPRLGSLPVCLMAIAMGWMGPAVASGQAPSGYQAAVAMEEAMVEAIARAERSVVAIARVRKGGRGIRLPLTVGNEFPLERGSGVVDAIPTSPDFVPNEFATGVVIDRQGHILTNYHVLGDPEENDYYMWVQRRPLRVASIERATGSACRGSLDRPGRVESFCRESGADTAG